ncbi:MAG TPA: 4-hydroxy-tetrahydrodipicolinate synthase [Xanthomonadales bacterium]|nr:4-hydroxy-tetrahydrodipicolinate synthase [Xanthomonadales bacterium]
MFTGSIVALVTPMDQQGRLDLPAVRELVTLHLKSGTSALVVAGTTGESPTLEGSEFQALLSAVCEQVAGAVPVVAGTGSANTVKSVEMTRRAADLGADGVLVVTPYYNRPTQSGLIAHFSAVADAAPVPVLMYNVPARTGVDMQAETTVALAQHPRIAGVKEALPNLERIENLLGSCPEDFCVLSGDDGTCAQAMLLGAAGVVSVAANVDPVRMSALCRAALAGDRQTTERVDGELRELFGLLGIEPNPIPVKWALRELGLIEDGIRLPLQVLDERHRGPFRACLKNLQLV